MGNEITKVQSAGIATREEFGAMTTTTSAETSANAMAVRAQAQVQAR